MAANLAPARARGERLSWLQAPPGSDERVVEVPWVLSRLVAEGRVLEVGYAFAEPAYLAGLLRAGVDLSQPANPLSAPSRSAARSYRHLRRCAPAST